MVTAWVITVAGLVLASPCVFSDCWGSYTEYSRAMGGSPCIQEEHVGSHMQRFGLTWDEGELIPWWCLEAPQGIWLCS
jgi:hypothetical protein